MLRRVFYLVLLMSGLLVSSMPARAQGCIMCYESAEAAGKGVQDALRSGVLVLLVPVALLLITMAVLVWRSGVVQNSLGAQPPPQNRTSFTAPREAGILSAFVR